MNRLWVNNMCVLEHGAINMTMVSIVCVEERGHLSLFSKLVRRLSWRNNQKNKRKRSRKKRDQEYHIGDNTTITRLNHGLDLMLTCGFVVGMILYTSLSTGLKDILV